MVEKRFTLEQEYDVDGNAEDCYVDNVTGKIYHFDDEFCDYNFLKDVNNIIETLTHENDELKKENWILTHFFEQVYYDYLVSVYDADDNELMEMSNAFQSKDLRKILRFCIGKTDKAKLKYYSNLYEVNLK